MTESDWLRANDPDGMMDYIVERFTPRRWRLLTTAFLRRRFDVIPEGILRELIDTVEARPVNFPAAEAKSWHKRIDNALPTLIDDAAELMREVVSAADPDAVDQPDPLLDRPNLVVPALPLFRAASRHAVQAIALSNRPIELAAEAVLMLLDDPGRITLFKAAGRIEDAVVARTEANRYANNALRMKQQGDELADSSALVKNKRVEESKAIELVRRVEEAATNRSQELEFDDEAADRAVRKALGRFLLELAGNPFSNYRFDRAWRTPTVIQIAQAIEADRAFDRMNQLADALLDADCDEEAILRHLRGTELHIKDKTPHMRGCWVIDRILYPSDPLFGDAALVETTEMTLPDEAPAPAKAPKAKPAAAKKPAAKKPTEPKPTPDRKKKA